MIILEIGDEAGVSHYEILGLTREALAGLDDKATTAKIRNAAKKVKGPYFELVQRGNKEAEEKVNRINQAETALKKSEAREKYDKELESGKGAMLEILRTQRIAPPFFWDRNVRFRVIEQLLEETG